MTQPTEQAPRVTTLELFFDLVFVFTITQLTTVLVKDPNGRGVARVLLMLALIWWMYGGYAWLTNSVTVDRDTRRLLLLGGMAGFLVMALALPTAFGGSGLTFALGYLVVIVVHGGMFMRASPAGVAQAFSGILPWNITAAALVLIGGAIGGTTQYVLWAVAVALECANPRLTSDEGFVIAPAHFVERHGLVVIVAIGESVVAIGIGAAGLPVDAELVGVALLGLALSACLWWTYFGAGDDVEAEEALSAAPVEARPRLAIDAYFYLHLPILFGIVAVASAIKKATGHAGDPLEFARALALSGGVALFMGADALFRRTLGIGSGAWRGLAALLAFAALPLGTELSAVAQLAALVILLVAVLAAERRHLGARREARRAKPPAAPAV
ncbi:MAG TPA: low temperature requirement protein A [Thermoleophilaceae bacterium]